MKLEHIGVAVKDLDKSKDLINSLLGFESYKSEYVASEQVETAFYTVGDAKLELLGATSENSAIAKYLNKNREGVHHLAFTVDCLETEIERLKGKGFEFVNEQPKDGADNKRIVFLHPKTTNGILIELCSEKK